MKKNVLFILAALIFLAACNFEKRPSKDSDPDEIVVAAYYFPNYHNNDPRNIINKGMDWSEWELVKKGKFKRRKYKKI